MYSHFIAVPMSSIPPSEYEEFRASVSELVADIRRLTGRDCFCAALHAEKLNFDHPAVAYEIDIRALRASDEFVLIWPAASMSSAIFEAGYAAALGKRVTFLVKDKRDLPFMLRNADEQKQGAIRIETFTTPADWTNLVFHRDQMKDQAWTPGI